jgi:hypothetical protein
MIPKCADERPYRDLLLGVIREDSDNSMRPV